MGAEDLRREIAEKEAELQRLKEQEREAGWPRTTTDYLHGSKESAYEKAAELLDCDYDDDEVYKFGRNYLNALYEVEFELEVQRDGTSRIVKVDGRRLEDETD